MKILNCPLNGPRNISEFVYGGEVKNLPDLHACDDKDSTVCDSNADKASAVIKEWWFHSASGYWFIAERHTASDEIIASYDPSAIVHCTQATHDSRPSFRPPQGSDLVDFDEDLQSKDRVNATRLGCRDNSQAKRFSTVEEGALQGRHPALATARRVAEATDRTLTESGVTTATPPVMAEKLTNVAGRIFSPYRHTPVHQRHIEIGAQMIPAGLWRRPAFYGDKEQRVQWIHQEAQAVRHGVGIIDVSTLGGLEIRGPDAAELLNRIYTFTFLKQPVGKIRYAVLTNEQGVVVDDGVACRISPHHFYVTATTSGVDSVYREMTKWNAQWQLDVDIANVTSAFSAVNVAGPLARKVLEKLCLDVDFSQEAFPYLGYREGTIDGVPVRLLRVGFVGELSYEIHMPSLSALMIWDQLMLAGDEFKIRPFGVETQRLLRLEKGHFIIGLDTDSMSHPGELSLEWAVNRKKPFFIGRKSVDRLMSGAQKRQLVGFKLPASSVPPKPGHPVLTSQNPDSAISGNVTSSQYSPTVDANIGLAYVGVAQRTVGSRFPIRVDNGELVMAEVVELPFYDPENKRQEVE